MTRAAKGEGSFYATAEGWRGYVTVDGKRKYFSAKTKAEAARKRRALITQRETGQLVAGRTPTMKSWVEQWMKTTSKDRSLATNAAYKSYIEKYIVPGLGHKRIDRITIEDLEQLYDSMEERGLSGSTRHQCHSIIRVALKHAMWRGHLPRNVATMVEPPSASRPKATTLTEEQLLRVMNVLKTDRFRARWHLSFDYGLRPGEAIAPEWRHLDWENQSLEIAQQIQQINGMGAQGIASTKTDAGARVIAMPDYMVDMFRATKELQDLDKAQRGDEWKRWSPDGKDRDFIFTRPDGMPLLPSYDREYWKGILERADVPYTRRYTTRHTAASMAIADGADIPSLAEMMGHANTSVTLQIYTHALEERKRVLATKTADRFSRLMES